LVGRLHWDVDFSKNFFGLYIRLEHAAEKAFGIHPAFTCPAHEFKARSQSDHYRHVVGRWIGVHKTAADCSTVAYLHIGDQTRGSGEQGAGGTNLLVSLDTPVANERTEPKALTIGKNGIQ
jgi:hypothetical protein